MDDEHYDSDTDDYYDDDTIVDLSDICKNLMIARKTMRPLSSKQLKRKKYVHEYCALYTYVCCINYVTYCYLYKFLLISGFPQKSNNEFP